MNKYNEAMDKIEVSAEMKSRILQNLAKELAEEETVPAEGAEICETSQTFDAVNASETVKSVDNADVSENEVITKTDEREARALYDTVNKSIKETGDKTNQFDISDGEMASRKRKTITAFRRYGALAATFAVLFLGVTALMRAQGGKLSSTAPSYSAEMAADSAMMSEAPAYEEAATEAAVMSEAPAEAPEMSEATQEAAKVTAGAAYEKAAGTTQDAAYATESAAEVEEVTDSDAFADAAVMDAASAYENATGSTEEATTEAQADVAVMSAYETDGAEAAPISGPGAARVLVLLLGSILMLALFAGAIVGITFLIRFIVQKVKKRYKP